MIDNIRNNQISHVMGNNGLPHADAASKRVTDDSDATLQVNFADLINQAVQVPEAGMDPVQEARKLLASGRLTSPENIRSVAENIVSFGI
jgi:hypothetical protein